MRKTTVMASRGEDVVSVELWVRRENIYRSELTEAHGTVMVYHPASLLSRRYRLRRPRLCSRK